MPMHTTFNDVKATARVKTVRNRLVTTSAWRNTVSPSKCAMQREAIKRMRMSAASTANNLKIKANGFMCSRMPAGRPKAWLWATLRVRDGACGKPCPKALDDATTLHIGRIEAMHG